MKRKERILIAALLGVLLLSLCVGIYWTHVKEKRTYEAPKETATDIHVVLSTSDFSDIFHEKVTVTSDQPFRVCYANVTEYKEAGEIVEITEESAIEDIYMLTPQKGASLQVLSISRGYGSPKYEGALEIINTLGGLVLANQVSVETYLRYVVPSEMPASYGAEALRRRRSAPEILRINTFSTPRIRPLMPISTIVFAIKCTITLNLIRPVTRQFRTLRAWCCNMGRSLSTRTITRLPGGLQQMQRCGAGARFRIIRAVMSERRMIVRILRMKKCSGR